MPYSLIFNQITPKEIYYHNFTTENRCSIPGVE